VEDVSLALEDINTILTKKRPSIKKEVKVEFDNFSDPLIKMKNEVEDEIIIKIFGIKKYKY
jgi:hypothetical protein